MALNLKSDNVESIVKDLQRFVLYSAEKVLEKPLLNGLRSKTIFHKAVLAIVVDVFDTIELWTFWCKILWVIGDLHAIQGFISVESHVMLFRLRDQLHLGKPHPNQEFEERCWKKEEEVIEGSRLHEVDLKFHITVCSLVSLFNWINQKAWEVRQAGILLVALPLSPELTCLWIPPATHAIFGTELSEKWYNIT